MATPARRKATYEDLLAVPDHVVAEIIDGELITSPRPSLPHALASSMMGADLIGPFGRGTGGSGGGPGGWWILFEPELHLGADVVVPDLVGWRRSRMPVLPQAAACKLAPDWICEVVSPTTSRVDRVFKTALYAREKIAHLWIADPLAQTLEVFRLESGKWVMIYAFDGPARVRVEPFQDVELDLSRWWIETAAREGGPAPE